MKKSPSKVKKVAELFDDDDIVSSPKGKSPHGKISSSEQDPSNRPYISSLDYANFLWGKPYETKVSYLQWDKPTGAKQPPHKPQWKIAEEQRGPPPLLYPIFPKEIGERTGKSKILFKFYTDTPRIQTPLGRTHIPRTHMILRKEMNRSTPEFKAASSRPAFVQGEDANRPLLLAETVWALERQHTPLQRPPTDNIMEQLHALDTGRGPQPVVVPRSEQLSDAVRTLRIEAAKAKQQGTAPATLKTDDYEKMIQTVKQGSLLAANGNLAGLRQKFNEIQLNTFSNSRPDLIPTHLRPRSATTILQSPMKAPRSPDVFFNDDPSTMGATHRTIRPHSAAAGPNGVATLFSLQPPPLPGGLPHIPQCSIPRPDQQPNNPPQIEQRSIITTAAVTNREEIQSSSTEEKIITGTISSSSPVHKSSRPGSAAIRPGSAALRPGSATSSVDRKIINHRGSRPSSAAIIHLDPEPLPQIPVEGIAISPKKDSVPLPSHLPNVTVVIPPLNLNRGGPGGGTSSSLSSSANPNPFPSFTPTSPLRHTTSRGNTPHQKQTLLFSPLTIQGQKVKL